MNLFSWLWSWVRRVWPGRPTRGASMAELFDLLYRRAEDWTYHWLAAAQVPDQAAPTALEPDKGYLTGWLRSGRLVYHRELWARLHAVTHSVMTLSHQSSDK